MKIIIHILHSSTIVASLLLQKREIFGTGSPYTTETGIIGKLENLLPIISIWRTRDENEK